MLIKQTPGSLCTWKASALMWVKIYRFGTTTLTWAEINHKSMRVSGLQQCKYLTTDIHKQCGHAAKQCSGAECSKYSTIYRCCNHPHIKKNPSLSFLCYHRKITWDKINYWLMSNRRHCSMTLPCCQWWSGPHRQERWVCQRCQGYCC